jgi:hypothetical protein
LRQSYEYKQLLQNSIYFPMTLSLIYQRIKTAFYSRCSAGGMRLIEIRKLAELMKNIFSLV